MEFQEFEGTIKDDDESVFGPAVELEASVTFSESSLMSLSRKKQEYLSAAAQEEVSDEEVIQALGEEIQNSIEIIFNRIGPDFPPEGLYEQVNQDQWKQKSIEDYYAEYSDLLNDLTADMDSIPSIPGLYFDFLLAASKSDTHDIPAEPIVGEILSQHIETIRIEQQSREGVSKLKSELESKGINPRTASSVAKSMDDYIKSDAELQNGTD
jgi:hypothetical protein